MADDEIEQQFETPEEPGDGGGDVSPPADPPSSPPAEQPRMVQVGNYTVPEEDVTALLEFQNWARSNPDKMEAFGQYLRGEAEFVKPDAKKEPEIDWDTVDPTVKSVYEQQQQRLEELQQRMQQFEAPLSALQEDRMQQVRLEAQSALDAATGKIMDRFKLNDDELEELAQEAAGLNIVPSLRAQGMPAQAALETALETAYWRNEKWRSKVVDEEIASRGADSRKARASQVTGTSGGSDNGLDSRPRNESERRNAMAAEIAEALRGTP